ncbi:ABC transporter substrate-binding protein/permease [Vagococcus elongatus]|uniref:ABC transporter permease n=1 Tax=Vagococcus elongatus TaxID=180344 RepID=A0A430B5H5_9ENTE|nr:ABC transporter substrate-binding protein/permease [Vagococcus elongatus]RSU15549.1 ABC transporter permease [Vagococcus elongatus]
MKKIVSWLIPLFLLSVCSMPGKVFAEEEDPVYDKVMESGELVIGLSAGYAPYEFHATVDGKDTIVGFDISIANKIADDLGVKLKITEMNFDSLLGALKTGKIDAIISGMSPTPERLQEVNFSDSYMEVEQKVIIRKENAEKFLTVNDFDGAKVGVQKQSTQEALAKKELLGSQLVSLPKGADVVLNLQNKKVDAAVLESVVAEAYASQDKNLFVTDVAFEDGKKETAIAISKSAPVLEAKINESIQEIKDQNLLPGWQKEANQLMFKDEGFFKKYYSYFIKGTVTTMFLAVLSVIPGIVLGTFLALMRLSKQRGLKLLSTIYIEFVRGTPLMAQVFIIFFGSTVLGFELSAFNASIVALGLNSAAYVAEIIRAGIQSIDVGQWEASSSLGMNQSQVMRLIILPQAVKNILPAFGNELVTIVKESSIVSVIGVTELMFQAGVVQGASFKPFLPIAIVSLIYFVLTFTLSRAVNYYERKLSISG